MLTEAELKELISSAISAREGAYVPYSRFRVGAALLCADGLIYTGCNIENAAYTPSNCAERTAFFKAVSEGKRDFLAIAVVAGTGGSAPCGVCRQVMMEFCDPDKFLVVIAADEEHYSVRTLGELLPMAFGPGDLGV